MKKAISLILLLVLLLVSAAGCTDYAKTPSAGESTSLPGETETATDKTNASSYQPVFGNDSKMTSPTDFQGKTDKPGKKQSSNDVGTANANQTTPATASEPLPASGVQSGSVTEKSPSVTSNEGVDLPIDSFG